MSKTLKNDFFDVVMPYVTLIGEAGVFWILCALIMICFRATRKAGFVCALSMLIDFILCNVLIKNIVDRVRPDQLLWNAALIFLPSDASFPSGHTAISFAAAAAIFTQNKKIGIFALIIAALVGFSRLYLCVHWLSDVIFGALLGSICAVTAHFMIKIIYNKSSLK